MGELVDPSDLGSDFLGSVSSSLTIRTIADIAQWLVL